MAGPLDALRRAAVAAGLALLALTPVALGGLSGLGPEALVRAAATGALDAVEAVGFVLVPQALLAVGVLGLALERVTLRALGRPARAAPRWLEPAVESALLLGMLGTLSGMVSGFVGIDPAELEPGPLVHGLGVALRSSLVGFSIALAGVWVKAPSSRLAALRRAEAS